MCMTLRHRAVVRILNILNPGRAEQAAPKVGRQQGLILPLYFFTLILCDTQAEHFERRGQEHHGVNRERDYMKR